MKNSDINDKTIKVSYKFKMRLITALHCGMGEEHPRGAADIVKNGRGEYIIPGSSLAGVFFDNLQRIFPDITEKDLYKKCTLRNATEHDKDKDKAEASNLIFRTVTFNKDAVVLIRDRVKIEKSTKTAEDGAKFSYLEIEPVTDKGEALNFEINIEIDNISKVGKSKLSKDSINEIDKWVKSIAYCWHNEGVAFGGFSSSGNGWAKLEKAECFVIDSKDNYLSYLDDKLQYDEMAELDVKPEEYNEIYKHYTITVKIGDEPDRYGTNSLLIRGGDSNDSVNKSDVDGVFINNGKEIFIPGSSLKGTISFFMEKYQKKEIWEKLTGQDGESGGIFLFEDIYPENFEKGHLKQLEYHSEDEFTRGVLNKFNEERAFYTNFQGKIRVLKSEYAKKQEEIDKVVDLLKQGFKHRLIELGAGGCYPEFKLEEKDI